MKKSIAILVLGLGAFVAALFAVQTDPILRQMDDSAIHADYTAPLAQANVGQSTTGYTCSQVGGCTLAEVTISGKATTGKAHVARSASRAAAETDTAQTSANPAETTFGQFSTAGALDYNPARYHNHVPNPHMVQGQITIASHPGHAR